MPNNVVFSLSLSLIQLSVLGAIRATLLASFEYIMVDQQSAKRKRAISISARACMDGHQNKGISGWFKLQRMRMRRPGEGEGPQSYFLSR